MHRKLRRVLGTLLIIIPPFTGMWLFYTWCFEPDHNYYQRKLIDYFSVPRAPTYRTSQKRFSDIMWLRIIQWQTPWGDCILWKDGSVSLHTGGGCIMTSGFIGDCINARYKRRLEQLASASVWPNKLTKYDFVAEGFVEAFIMKCRNFVKKVRSPRWG